jgi:diguanylate cyclase (GGDEF)-like protein
MIQTNEYHDLYYKNIGMDIKGLMTYISIEKNIWYHVHSLFTLLAFFIVVGYTRTLYMKSTDFYKKRAKYTLISLIIPLVGGLIYVLGFTPNQLDILPFIYAPVGLIWFFTVHKYGVFDWMPITYKKVFEQISEGVIVIDTNGSVVDYNLSAFEIFKSFKLLSKGMNIHGLLDEIEFKEKDHESCFILTKEDIDYTYELTLSEINGVRDKKLGQIMVIKDITQEAAAKALLEEFASKDALTGIHNRRYFFELCNEVIHKAGLLDKKISFVLMAIDYFKAVNDAHGHIAGDFVLKEVTQVCKKSLRDVDVIGRYGGEEFGILIYDLTIDETEKIIERMARNIREHKFYVSKTNYIHKEALS